MVVLDASPPVHRPAGGDREPVALPGLVPATVDRDAGQVAVPQRPAAVRDRSRASPRRDQVPSAATILPGPRPSRHGRLGHGRSRHRRRPRPLPGPAPTRSRPVSRGDADRVGEAAAARAPCLPTHMRWPRSHAARWRPRSLPRRSALMRRRHRAVATGRSLARQPDDPAEHLHLLLEPCDRVQQEMRRAGGDECLQLLADVVRCAEDAGLVGERRAAVCRREPPLDLGARRCAVVVHAQEDPLGDRERRPIAPLGIQRVVELRDRPGEGLRPRAAGAHPAVPDARGAAQRIGVEAAEPDRRRLLHRTRAEVGAVGAEDLTVVRHVLARPQGADQLDRLREPPHPAFDGHLEQRVLLDAAEADAERRPTTAQVVERGDDVGHVHGVVRRQDHHRDTEPDLRGERGGVRQHGQRVEATDLVDGVVRDPQVAEPELVGAAGDVAHDALRDRVR